MTDETSFGKRVRTWSNIDLLDVARHIDKDAFPARHRIVEVEIERRRSAPTPDAIWLPPPPALTKYATFWRRVGAILIDGLVFVPAALGAQFLTPASSDLVLRMAPGFVGALLFLLYSIILHARNGQTLGKMAARVRLLDLSEEKLTIAQAITRDLVPLSLLIASFTVMVNIDLPTDDLDIDFAHQIPGLALVSISVFWGLAEILTMATNRKKRAVHDFIAGSVVLWIDAPVIEAAAVAAKSRETEPS